MKRKPLSPRPDGKPRRKLRPKKRNAERLTDFLVKKRGAIRVVFFGVGTTVKNLLD